MFTKCATLLLDLNIFISSTLYFRGLQTPFSDLIIIIPLHFRDQTYQEDKNSSMDFLACYIIPFLLSYIELMWLTSTLFSILTYHQGVERSFSLRVVSLGQARSRYI